MGNAPHIVTALPGPEASRILLEDKQYISPSYTRSYPLVIASGSGLTVTDVDGNRFLDFTSGIGVNATGHSHPSIVDAIKRQLDRFIHMSGTDFYYESESRLARILSEIAPGNYDKRVFFTNSGAESVEAAMKLARYHTKRSRFLAFYGGFHGRTFGALSLSASKSLHRDGFAPLLPGVSHAPYPYCYRCPFNMKQESCCMHCVDWIEETMFKTSLPPGELAAIVVEPIQGEGGYIVPPDQFLPKLRELADRYGIMLVVDEVQAGMGRTGRMFASEHFGVVPDIITLAKGIASGMPLGAIVAKKEIMNWPPGAHANTFGGNPVSCEAAIETIRLLRGGLVDNASDMGEHLQGRLHTLIESHETVGDVRGRGLMVGVELVKNKKTREAAAEYRDKVVYRCFEKGLLLLGAGKNVIRFIPSLNVNAEEIDIAVDIFESCLGACRA